MALAAVAEAAAAVVHREDGKMAFLNETDLQRIEEAVQRVEQTTKGELVTVIARQSDAYDAFPYLWAALFTLAGSAIAFLVFPGIETKTLIAGQLGAFVLLLLFLSLSKIRTTLVPKSIKNLRASRVAREQFFTQSVFDTADRSGVLIFVSVAEHYVEIIADKGVSQHIDNAQWQKVIDQFVGDVKAGRTADGFITAIDACGDLMAAPYPADGDNPNQLPNRLIVL